MSHPRLCLRTSLGDRAVSRGSPGPIGTHVVRDRRVSPYLVSRVATPNDDMGEQARSVNLLEIWGLVSRRGQRGNPLANGQYSSLGSQAHDGQDRRFLPNSVRVLSRDRCILLGYMGSLTTGSPTGPLSSFGESGLNVQSGHSKGHLRVIRAMLHRNWGH